MKCDKWWSSAAVGVREKPAHTCWMPGVRSTETAKRRAWKLFRAICWNRRGMGKLLKWVVLKYKVLLPANKSFHAPFWSTWSSNSDSLLHVFIISTPRISWVQHNGTWGIHGSHAINKNLHHYTLRCQSFIAHVKSVKMWQNDGAVQLWEWGETSTHHCWMPGVRPWSKRSCCVSTTSSEVL